MLNKILKKIFRKTEGAGTISHNRGFSTKPIITWKRNVFAVATGLGIGLYIGQYFPDNYFPEFLPYLPDIEQLKDYAPNTQAPNPQYPKSLFDYPKDAILSDYMEDFVREGEYEVTNDMTKKKQKFKVTKFFKTEPDELE